MSARRGLMCRPTYFDVAYSINPWMDPGNRVDQTRARAQWEQLHDLITRAGIQIDEIEPAPGLPDMTFAADCGLPHGQCFIAANFRHAERRGETAHYISWFRQRGYQLHSLPDHLPFEGAADTIRCEEGLLFGYGIRSSREAAPYLQRLLPTLEVVAALEMVDPRLYHLQSSITVVERSLALYSPRAFAPEARQLIERYFRTAIAVEEEDAIRHLVCNSLAVGRTVIVHDCTHELEKRLARLDIEVIRCDVSEFRKSGASVRCLMLDLDSE